jgi:hypothetical protein
MFDIFYSGTKPNLFAHERAARDIKHARSLSRTRYFWWVNYLTDYTGFDFLFEPVPWQAEYTHAWPSQHHEYSGTFLVPTNNTEIQYKFHKNIIPNKQNKNNYNQLQDNIQFDYTWAPHPFDPPYRYVFGNQWYPANRMPTVEYHVPGAQETKYIFTPRAELLPNKQDPAWHTQFECEFDYSWRPDPGDTPYIYVFGNQWWSAVKMPTVEYHVPGAQERKYMPYPRAKLPQDLTNWHMPKSIDSTEFDYSWCPDPGDPPYRYQFGTQHQATGGPSYQVPGATEVKYVTTPRARRTQVDNCWHIPENTNLEAFDWTWHPDDRDPPYCYQFATQWNRAGGPVYTVPGATEVKYITAQMARMLPTDRNWTIPDGIDINSFDFSWTPDTTEQPYIYEFGTQWQKTGGPRYHVPGATEVKYITNPRANKISHDSNWTVPTGADIDSFDWTWHPDATEQPYIYQFGTQHQRTGGPQYRILGATETKYIDQIRIKTDRVATAIYEIDHLDGNAGKIPNTTKTVRYFDNYLDTLKRLANNIPEEYEFVWICSSICDYEDFDFTWHPEIWQAGMLHVFPSAGEKFGDTFFMHVPTFRSRSDKLQLLDWYDLNFMDISVPRRPMPVIAHTYDTHVEAVKNINWTGPLAIFVNQDNTITDIPTVPLWREKTKTVVPLSAGAGTVIVPKTCVPYIKRQLYDYPNIDRTQRHMYTDNLLDIVFIDNGEPNADDNYIHLKWAAERANNICIHRSTGVTGRVAAYRAAAELSCTPWFFAVFAKLKVDSNFDWSWQPDRLQEPKHYIFHAHNPVNELVYGHQAMIAYNKKLVLENTALGLDFTLDQAHEVVPILSGMANYHTDAWTCWRTAFRECIKLRDNPDVESQYRLRQWLTRDNTLEQWSKKGAEDAVEYYNSVGGAIEELKKSYDWTWLASYALLKRNLIQNQ